MAFYAIIGLCTTMKKTLEYIALMLHITKDHTTSRRSFTKESLVLKETYLQQCSEETKKFERNLQDTLKAALEIVTF